VRRRQGLALAVAGGSHEQRIHTEGHVVHEDPVAGDAEVDPSLLCFAKRSQCTDRVGGIESDVAGEVVARPGGHADECQVTLHGDLSRHCLRSVAPSHSEGVGPPLRRSLCKTAVVIAETDDHVLDPSSLGLLG